MEVCHLFIFILFQLYYFALLLVGRWKWNAVITAQIYCSWVFCLHVWFSLLNLKLTTVIRWDEQAWVAALFLLPPRQNVAEYQNLPESSCRFRSILLYACETKSWFVSYVVEKDACAYHCATDGMLMALKRWNTNNESKLDILIKNTPRWLLIPYVTVYIVLSMVWARPCRNCALWF